MACELLIHRNKNNYSHSDIIKDKRGVFKKGHLVAGKTLPHSGWGAKEVFEAGNFVHIRVTDATWDELKDYAKSWILSIDYTKLGEDLSIDGHRFKIFSTNPGVSQYGNLTRAKIEKYLSKWNATIFSVSTNNVTIDVTINNLLKSPAFWDYVPGEGIEDLGYTQLSYDQTTGEHVYELDYSTVLPEETNRDAIATKLAHRLSNRGVTFDNHDSINQTAEATIFRNDVLTHFRDEVYKDVYNIHTLYVRQFYIEEADVDSLVNYSINHNGNAYEVTKTQLVTYFKDMLNNGSA